MKLFWRFGKGRLIIVLLVILAAVLAGIWYYVNLRPAPADDLAKCVRDRGIILYGSNDCTDCQAQATAFSRSFRFVPYVNCSDQPQRCVQDNVKTYPTWAFPDSRRVTTQMDLDVLARQTRCPVPIAAPAN